MWLSCAATAAQPIAFLLAKDIQARTQPLRIAFTCPRKLDNQLRDASQFASQHLHALQNDLEVKEIVNL